LIYEFENKEEEEQVDSSDSETRRRPASSTAARHSQVIGWRRSGSRQGSKR